MNRFERVDDRTIDDRVRAARGLIAVEFTAVWCGPCRVFDPILASVAQEFEGRLAVVELDTDVNPGAVIRYGVRSMPTLVFFRGGAEVSRSVGAVSAPVLRRRIDANLAGPDPRSP